MTKSVQTHPVPINVTFDAFNYQLMLLNSFVFYFYTRHMLIFKSPSVIDSFNTYSSLSAPGADSGATRRLSVNYFKYVAIKSDR